MKLKNYILASVACMVFGVLAVADATASPGGPPQLSCDNVFSDCVTEQELQDAIDNIELTPGPQGEKGDKGDQGVAGADGKDGIDGQDGAKGDKGDKGDQGEQGIQGVAGEKGDKGDQGEQGIAGVDGKDGVDGIDGIDGVDGQDADMTLVNANTDAIAANVVSISNNSQAIDAVNSNSIARDESLSSRIDDNSADIAQNRSLINDNAEEIEWIKGEVADVRDEMRDGLSQVAATGIIPDAEPGKFGVGIGCSSYKSNDSCALGLAWTDSDGRYKLKAAATEDVVSIGGMYNF